MAIHWIGVGALYNQGVDVVSYAGHGSKVDRGRGVRGGGRRAGVEGHGRLTGAVKQPLVAREVSLLSVVVVVVLWGCWWWWIWQCWW